MIKLPFSKAEYHFVRVTSAIALVIMSFGKKKKFKQLLNQ